MLRRFSLALISVLLASCTTLYGGKMVDPGYKIEKYLVTYKTEAPGGAGGSYHLVIDEGRLAIFNSNDRRGGGAILSRHWETEDSDHFASWSSKPLAIEVIVPRDRTRPAELYFYQSFEIQNIAGVERPVPRIKQAPDSRLLPIKHY